MFARGNLAVWASMERHSGQIGLVAGGIENDGRFLLLSVLNFIVDRRQKSAADALTQAARCSLIQALNPFGFIDCQRHESAHISSMPSLASQPSLLLARAGCA